MVQNIFELDCEQSHSFLLRELVHESGEKGERKHFEGNHVVL